MNLELYKSNYVVEIQGLCKDVNEWCDDGQGDHVACWDMSGFSKTYILNENQMNVSYLYNLIIDHLQNRGYCIQGDDIEFYDNGIYFNQIENKDGYYDENGSYICDYTFRLCINGVQVDDLYNIFKEA